MLEVNKNKREAGERASKPCLNLLLGLALHHLLIVGDISL